MRIAQLLAAACVEGWREGMAREPVTLPGLRAPGWTNRPKNMQLRGTRQHRVD